MAQCCVAIFHDLRHCRCRSSRCSGCGVSIDHGRLRLAVLYRYGPSRRLPKWRWISVGSVFAALAWLAGSSLFSWYLGNFANYNAAYGALGPAGGLMFGM